MIQKTQPFFCRALAQTIGAESIPNRGGYSKNSRYTADTFVVQPAQWSCRSSNEDMFDLNQNWNPNNNQLDQSMVFSSSSRLKNWRFRGPRYTYPSEKYEFVSWDDDIPNIYIYMESHKIHDPNYQPVFVGL